MGLRDILKKKDHDEDGDGHPGLGGHHGAPEFNFVRSDMDSEDVTQSSLSPDPRHSQQGENPSRLSISGMLRSNRSRSGSVSSNRSGASSSKESAGKRLSHRLHLSRAPSSSENVPEDLPEIVLPEGGEVDKDGAESQWEHRATMLARENEKHRSRPSSPSRNSSAVSADFARLTLNHQGDGSDDGRGSARSGSPASGMVSSKAIDEDIQQAIRLHEEGNLEESTAMFGRLADPKGSNNPLSQVLYGLALRHGWGCTPDPAAAISYLSAAASNAADIENLALEAGLKKGGAAKGELVLAIFELANCFRHGWGIPKDAIAAKQYYETAANLGDTDAMNEVAWCYLEGFGTKKDKFTAAQYYRRAEEAGNKILGNTWIWKDKYNPGNGKK
ncbi:HCP-like protein [Thozetella sp. PMI_491]|nr:HCP-like protein [Thozetella sp. PMI_491]